MKCYSKMPGGIPISGRSTTEQTFAMKVAAERTITSQNEKLHMIMVDMSKAFDSINRKELLNDFRRKL